MTNSIRADLFYGTAYGLALSGTIWTLVFFLPPLNATTLLLLAVAAALAATPGRARRLGRLTSTYPLLLAALLLDGPGTSLLVAAIGAGVTCFTGPATGRRRPFKQPAFELSRVTLAAGLAAAVYVAAGGAIGKVGSWPLPLGPVIAHALAYLLMQTGLARLAVRIGRGGRSPLSLLKSFSTSIPACLLATAVGQLAAWAFTRQEPRLMMLAASFAALVFAVHRGRAQRRKLSLFHRIRSERLHRSVTRALAKLMEAKDDDTQQHLRRVQSLCVDVGRRLGLPREELEALTTASLLHDIGKVAVPDGILTKPGRLTSQEMEYVKMHPGLGADVLQTIPFPFPLAPIVRHHHERWDGSGYPAGLKGEQIPLGSRILAAVDSYDALTSDRPYRKALSHAEAVNFLRRESERMFDSQVVEALIGHLEWRGPLHAPLQVATTESVQEEREPPAAGNLPQAHRELQALYDISRSMQYGLGLEEFLTLVACKVAGLVPHQSLVVYFLEPEEKLLRAVFAQGKAADKLRLMTIPLGERISGWAALQQRALIGQDHLTPLERDGSRSDLEDWIDDEEMQSLNSTLVAPLVAGDRGLGVITLYDHQDRRFGPDERRTLVRVAGYVAEVARGQDGRVVAGQPSLTDPLTGVPNARFLWLETAYRIAQPEEACPGFGLIAFRVTGAEPITERLGNEATDRMLVQIARRFAASCRESETLVRFGPDLFIVLSSTHGSGALIERWHDLAMAVEQPPLEAREGVMHQLRLTAAHAIYREDGNTLDQLLQVLDGRLSLSANQGRTVIPFRPRRSTGTHGA